MTTSTEITQLLDAIQAKDVRTCEVLSKRIAKLVLNSDFDTKPIRAVSASLATLSFNDSGDNPLVTMASMAHDMSLLSRDVVQTAMLMGITLGYLVGCERTKETK